MNIYLARPLPNGVGVVTQWFGQHPEWYAKYNYAGHNGIDYGVPLYTEVLAAQDGICTVGEDPGYGLYIKINHGKFTTLYAHLSRHIVKSTQQVSIGQIIGMSGNTGNSTGPHLHFELRIHNMRNPAYGNRVDPVPFREQ